MTLNERLEQAREGYDQQVVEATNKASGASMHVNFAVVWARTLGHDEQADRLLQIATQIEALRNELEAMPSASQLGT